MRVLPLRFCCQEMTATVCTDHYTGITDTWSQGKIFCSEVTGKLIIYLLGVDPALVHTLPMNKPQQIQGELSMHVMNDTWPGMLPELACSSTHTLTQATAICFMHPDCGSCCRCRPQRPSSAQTTPSAETMLWQAWPG